MSAVGDAVPPPVPQPPADAGLRILVSNDDGVLAPGIALLAEVCATVGQRELGFAVPTLFLAHDIACGFEWLAEGLGGGGCGHRLHSAVEAGLLECLF